jgi:DNA-binding MarR family transcriptional regulator
MHSITFGFKRAYSATLKISRRTLRKMGLTAARFDLLYAVHIKGKWPAYQSYLWRTLGVDKAVVSRMLKSLEALGYVKRAVDPYDTRQRRVRLTARGRSRILRGIRVFIRWGYVSLALACALVPERPHDMTATRAALDEADRILCLVRDQFGDTADLSYPWHPDD